MHGYEGSYEGIERTNYQMFIGALISFSAINALVMD